MLIMNSGIVEAARNMSISDLAPNFIAITILHKNPNPIPNTVIIVTIIDDLAIPMTTNNCLNLN
jgi:hypothetical protein